MGTGDSFIGVERLGREADDSPQPSAEVKDGGAIPPLPHVFLVWYFMLSTGTTLTLPKASVYFILYKISMRTW
jgi:hypothetical protein